MRIEDLLEVFNQTETITEDIVEAIQEDVAVRPRMIDYFRRHPEHPFPESLLRNLIDRRRRPEEEIEAESLMFAAYAVAMRRNVADSVLLWEAKCVDFDTYCGFDSQLVVAAGLHKTISYLSTLSGEAAVKAVTFLQEWGPENDEEIEDYFQEDNRPWYI